MGAVWRAMLLFVPLTVFWQWAPAPWDAATAIAVGVLMLLGVVLGRPWTAWLSAPRASGLRADPLFLQVNQLMSGLWGGLLVVTGAAWLSGAGPIWRWAPFVAGGLVSAALPGLIVRWRLRQRLLQADPHPWVSPLQAPPGVAGGRGAPAPLDVAVVGAGIGGLTAAALLARAGARVAVFEQHDKPGGFCHCWDGVALSPDGQRQVFRFDAGVHDISGCFDGGTVTNLLHRLDLDSLLDWRRMDHAFVDGGGRWDVPRSWDAFTDALVQRHPGDAAGLRALLADVRSIFASMYATAPARGGVPGAPASVAELLAFAQQHPLAVAWMNRPAGDLLDHHRLSPAARAQVLGLSAYVTHDPGMLTVSGLVPLLGYFLHGGHYPVGGSAALPSALAGSLALDGGELHLCTPVQAVRLADDGRGVRGLRLGDGRTIDARCVVLASDALAALRLFEPSSAVPSALRTQLLPLRPAASMFSVHLGVRGPAPDLPPVVHLHSPGQPGLEMVLPCAVDPSAAPPGHYTLELMRLLPPGEALPWFDDPEATDPATQRNSPGYLAHKARVADAMIDAAQQLIPGLREGIVFRREASPITFRRYGFSTQGSVYGVTDAQGRAAPVHRRSPVPGLVFAGSATAGAGVEPAMMSGAHAADALLPGLLARGVRLPAGAQPVAA